MMTQVLEVPWYGDPIWSFIATVAQVLSLLTIGFAIYEFASRGWRVQGSTLTVHQWAAANHTATGKRVHFADIMNVGGAPALLTAVVVIHGEIVADPNNRVKYWLGPGESMTVVVHAPDPTKTWFRFQWVSPSDRRFTFGAWQVLQPGTPLDSEWKQSYDRTRPKPWFLTFLKGYFAHKLGPGHDATTRVRMSRNIKRSNKRVSKVFGEVESATAWIFKGMTD